MKKTKKVKEQDKIKKTKKQTKKRTKKEVKERNKVKKQTNLREMLIARFFKSRSGRTLTKAFGCSK